jgi:hypothetical protein
VKPRNASTDFEQGDAFEALIDQLRRQTDGSLQPAVIAMAAELDLLSAAQAEAHQVYARTSKLGHTCQTCQHLDAVHFWSLDVAGCDGLYTCHQLDGTTVVRPCACARFVAPPPPPPTRWERLRTWWHMRRAQRRSQRMLPVVRRI